MWLVQLIVGMFVLVALVGIGVYCGVIGVDIEYEPFAEDNPTPKWRRVIQTFCLFLPYVCVLLVSSWVVGFIIWTLAGLN